MSLLLQIADEVGTPCFVYSKAAILGRYREYADALEGCSHTICYAVKANSNLSVLRLPPRSRCVIARPRPRNRPTSASILEIAS